MFWRDNYEHYVPIWNSLGLIYVGPRAKIFSQAEVASQKIRSLLRIGLHSPYYLWQLSETNHSYRKGIVLVDKNASGDV